MTVFRPIADYVVVRRDEAEEVTPGGIVLPENAKGKPTKGRVVAVGSGKILPNGEKVDLEVKEGDSVVFQSYSGNEVELDGETFVVLRESDVMLVLE